MPHTSLPPVAVDQARQRLVEGRTGDAGEVVELASLVATAYPALEGALRTHFDAVAQVFRAGIKQRRDARTYRRMALSAVGDLTDEDGVRRGLRRFAVVEKIRIAARELLLQPSVDVDVTAREMADLADVSIDLATSEALLWAERRFGTPLAADGSRCAFTVLGMGKLGGRELNAGSDVDLLMLYATDDGEVRQGDGPSEQSLHEHFVRATRRITATLDEVMDDGFVFRVDLRLRPEGSRGPLVNSLAAAERYYEAWGRTWERAALLRARPVAGDLALGQEVLLALQPFVWRREVNPRVADEMISLLERARAETQEDPTRDIKIGPGGIRDAEFFVQSLQLIWGGRDARLRSPSTLDALRRLRGRGLVTDREVREVGDGYMMLRRIEHRIHFATGVQTHRIPDAALWALIARSLGYRTVLDLESDLDAVRKKLARRLASLSVHGTHEKPELARLYVALDARDVDAAGAALEATFGATAKGDLPRHIVSLARPDSLLGAATRDRFPELAPTLLVALSESADPEQAARFLASLFARMATPTVYARSLDADPRVLHRLVSVLGASAFLGESLIRSTSLIDRLIFSKGAPSQADVSQAVTHETCAVATSEDDDPTEAFVGALRRAKAQVTLEVGLADLGGEIETRDATLLLSTLADATMAEAVGYALSSCGLPRDAALAIIAMGKLGGREIGYGSDLDIFFVFDGDEDTAEKMVRVAQRVIRLLSTAHGDGPGYELDTRLRPSGNQGLLVVSLASFSRYHLGEDGRAEDWERQALIKARPCAGDHALARRVMKVADEAAYERGEPNPERMHHLRMRMERELARERRDEARARYDLKLGHGGLADIEFAAQFLQMKHGRDARVRSPDTSEALVALESCGYLDATTGASLREAYLFLRRLEQRLRVVHGTSASLLEQGAPGLSALARGMGMRDSPRLSASMALLAHYRAVTDDVRAAYLRVIGLSAA